MICSAIGVGEHDCVHVEGISQASRRLQGSGGGAGDGGSGAGKVSTFAGDRHQRVPTERLMRCQCIEAQRTGTVADHRASLDDAGRPGNLAIWDCQQHDVETLSVEPASERPVKLGHGYDKRAAYAAIAHHGAKAELRQGGFVARHGLRVRDRNTVDRITRPEEDDLSHIVATGDRVTLEALGPEDEQEFLAAVAASRELHHPWIDAPDTTERIAAVLARNERPGNFTFLLRDRADGVLVGAVNVTDTVLGSFLSAFCGYWAFAAGYGRGLMTDGLTAVVRHSFESLGLHRLEANIQPANQRSIALAIRCGFRLEGFSPNYLKVDGAWRDHNRYAITVEDTLRQFHGMPLRPR